MVFCVGLDNMVGWCFWGYQGNKGVGCFPVSIGEGRMGQVDLEISICFSSKSEVKSLC